jgi:hypothetical protein
VAISTQVDEDSDAVKAFARAELDRAARWLAEQREPTHGEPVDGSLAALVAARDAQLWAAIDTGGSAHE